MAITILIHAIQPTNIGKKSVILHMKNTAPSTAFRRVEQVVNSNLNVQEQIDALTDPQKTNIWNSGTVLDEVDYRNTQKQANSEFFDLLSGKIIDGLISSDIDTTYADILIDLNTNTVVKNKLLLVLQNLQTPPELPLTKRERLLWFLAVASVDQVKNTTL